MTLARNLAIVALVALAIFLVPGGGRGLDVLLSVLSIAFFVAIAVLLGRLYREHRLSLEALTPRLRLVLYGSVGLALLAFVGTRRLFDTGGVGVLVWIALLGACSFGVFWVFIQARQY